MNFTFSCLCGGLIEGLIALIFIVFSFIAGKVTTHCHEKCCSHKKMREEYDSIGQKYEDGSDG